MSGVMSLGLQESAAQALTASDPATLALKAAAAKGSPDRAAKVRGAAEDFEQVFLNTMFQQMFTHVGDGPFSGGQGAQVWRSFLTDEYAKTFVKAGGVGIANEVQRMLLAQQEVR